MAALLAYIEPVPGRLYPLVPTLLELQRRGHRVAVRTGDAEADLLGWVGIDAGLLASELVDVAPALGQLAAVRTGEGIRSGPSTGPNDVVEGGQP